MKRSTLYVWVAQGKIPCRKIHGLIRFRPEEIDRWVESFMGGPPIPLPRKLGKSTHGDLDRLIAIAKREAYTLPCGKPDQDRAMGKEEMNGSV
ncbi:MAG: helix-turn-helix domain-containing protein [Nitrospirota bacterium]|nr:helix-turn-helix domain-containing protein [Nitrospirota bacterium]